MANIDNTATDANVNGGAQAAGGVAIAERTVPFVKPFAKAHAPSWLPALHEMNAKVLRVGRDRLPVRAAVEAENTDERPLIEIVEPGFATVGEIAVGRGAITGIATGRAGQLFVTNTGDDSVSVLDADSLAVVGTVTGIEAPYFVAAAGGRAYVSTVRSAYDSVAVIDVDTASVVTDHPVALSVRDLAVSPDGARVYLGRAGNDGADVAVIDTTTGQLTTIELAASTADAVAVSADGTRLYFATGTYDDAYGDGTLVVMDTADQTVLGGVAIAAPIRGVATGDVAGRAYVLSCDAGIGGVVDFVDTNSFAIIATVELGGAPTQLTLSADGERAYVIDGEDVIVLCTATHDIVDTVHVGTEPSAIAESADGTRLYVADYLGRVTVLSVAPTAALLARMMAVEAIEPQRRLALEPATV